MIEEMIGSYGNRLLLAAAGVGVALVLLVVVLWIVRQRGASSPFLRGGKNRQPRLQVLDAAAVDARRRIVLVRRDNVEHLVMIGGPTDIVIESGIGAEPVRQSGSFSDILAQQDLREASRDLPPALPETPLQPALAPPPARIAPPVTNRPAVAVPAQPQPVTEPAVQDQVKKLRPETPAGRPPAPAIQEAPRDTVPDVKTPPVPRPRPEEKESAQKRVPGEFERMLEAEMNSRMPGQAQGAPAPDMPKRPAPVAPPAPPPPVIASRPVAIPATPAEPAPDAEVQREIARIFGEMSATRDK